MADYNYAFLAAPPLFCYLQNISLWTHSCIFSSIVHEYPGPAWVSLQPGGDVVDAAIDDDPAVVQLPVARHLLARVASGRLVAAALLLLRR